MLFRDLEEKQKILVKELQAKRKNAVIKECCINKRRKNKENRTSGTKRK